MKEIKKPTPPICYQSLLIFSGHLSWIMYITVVPLNLALVYTRTGSDLKIKHIKVTRQPSPIALDAALATPTCSSARALFSHRSAPTSGHCLESSSILSAPPASVSPFLCKAGVLMFAESFRIRRWYLHSKVWVVIITVNKMWQADILLTFPWNPRPNLCLGYKHAWICHVVCPSIQASISELVCLSDLNYISI